MKYFSSPGRDFDLKALNSEIEASFAEHGRNAVKMPPKVYVDLIDGDFRTMPAYIPSMDIAGVKIVNVHPDNHKYGLPAVMALTVILDTKTGLPLAVLNATMLTDLRTAAAGAVAAKHLSAKKSIHLGIIGAGRQASAQVSAISQELFVEKISVWSRNEKHAEEFCSTYRDYDCQAATPEKVCDCDVLVTATPSKKPLVKREWIHDGTHINAIGADAPGKEELDPDILVSASVFVDDISQAVHSGEVNVPISKELFYQEMIAGTVGEVVLGKKGRRSPSEITVFDSTGLAIQDLTIAKIVMGESDFIELDFP